MKAIDFTCLSIVDRRRSAHLGVLPLGDKFYLIPLSLGVRRLVKKPRLYCIIHGSNVKKSEFEIFDNCIKIV